MKAYDIISYRLTNQQIAKTKFKKPEQVVKWLAAMQAQVFPMAKWAIALRSQNLTEPEVDKAFNEGKILRLHILRPTWHFVTAEDIGWMLKLSAPRVHQASAFMYRSLELEKKILNRASDIIAKSIIGKNYKNRNELKEILKRSKIPGDNLRYTYIIAYAELEGIICSGPRIGKQFTYALLTERAPKMKKMDPEESLFELTKRYFRSRGPATINDYVWWSGLTVKDAKKGIAMLPSNFKTVSIDGINYVIPKTTIPPNFNQLQRTFLMPDYDEYGISYKNRSALRNPNIPSKKLAANTNDFSHWVVVDGVISGTWHRIEAKKSVDVKTNMLTTLNKSQKVSLNNAIENYRKFFNKV